MPRLRKASFLRGRIVGVAGLEPESAAYQAITEYKSAALPIELHPHAEAEASGVISGVAFGTA